MKVIFLDIDGVLNTCQTFEDIREEYLQTGIKRIEIDLHRVKFLKKIVDETSAVIVLSSSWRIFGKMDNNMFLPLNNKMDSLLKLFNDYGLKIYDVTPRCNGNRQIEIYSWLFDKTIDNFIILDDEFYFLKDFINTYLINTIYGLCEEHVSKAIEMLNNDKKLLIKKS